MGTEEMLNVLDNSLSAAGPGVNDVHLSSTLNSEASKDASIQQNIVSMQPIGVDNILFSKPVEMPQESIFPLQPVLMEIDSDDCSETELIEEESCYIVEAFDDNPQNNSVNPVVINQQEITINPFTSIEVNNELKTKEVVEILPDLETGTEKPSENTEDTNQYKGNIQDIVTDFNIVDTETAKALKREDSLSFITIKEVFHESDKLEIDPETALTRVENDEAVKPTIYPPKAIHPTEKRRSIMEYSIVEPEPNLSFDSMPMFENENDP